jgi:hypothetical protein
MSGRISGIIGTSGIRCGWLLAAALMGSSAAPVWGAKQSLYRFSKEPNESLLISILPLCVSSKSFNLRALTKRASLSEKKILYVLRQIHRRVRIPPGSAQLRRYAIDVPVVRRYTLTDKRRPSVSKAIPSQPTTAGGVGFHQTS